MLLKMPHRWHHQNELISPLFVFRFADGLINVYSAGHEATLAMLTTVFSDGTATLLIVLVMTFGLIFPKMLIEGLWLKDQKP
jgi:hypothetical protein